MSIKGQLFNRKYHIAAVLLGLLGVAVFYAMASTISPWCKVLPHLDSAVWLRSAVEILQGKTMYVEIWDHKGPVLFLIQCLGMVLTPHSLTGLWILEVLWLFATLFSFYLIAKLVIRSDFAAFLAAALCYHPFYYFFHEGNTVEEWALPFIGFSLYIFIKYLMNIEVKRIEILLCGAMMACAFLCNGNLVSVWASFGLIILIRGLVKKEFKELRRVVLFFLIGTVSVFAVTAIVLGIQGALPSFLEIYFGFNSEYTGGVTLSSLYYSVMNFAYTDRWFIFSNALLLIILIHDLIKYHRLDWRWSTLVYSMISLLFAGMSGRGYAHYAIQLIPCMIIPMTVLINQLYSWCTKHWEFVVIAILALMLWLRFDYSDYYREKILWTMDENSDDYYAGGKLENYTIVNDYLGNPWSDELLDKWVVNDSW